MLRKWRTLTLVVAALALCAGKARSEIVKIRIEGEVSYVDSYSTLLNDLFTVGDPVTGQYVYDTDTGDSNPNRNVGDYRYDSSPYGVYLTVGSFAIGSNPDQVDFLLEIGDNHAYGSWDHYLFYSYVNSPLDNGLAVSLIGWSLADETGEALSSDDLPAVPPDLSDWGRDRGLSIEFGSKPGGSGVGVTINTVRQIPEPATVLVLGFGSVLFLKRRRI